MLELILFSLIKITGIVMVFVMAVSSVMVWVERKMSALIQDRIGPNRAAIGNIRAAGLMHVIADALKMLTKEDFDPESANPVLFRIAPFIAVIPPMLFFVVIPFGPGDPFLISNINSGLLFAFAITSLGVYGSTIGAWASNNNFALLGSIRTTAQMISYEVTLGLSIIGVLMTYESVYLPDVVQAQTEYLFGVIPKWGIFLQPLSFVMFLTASIAETKRAPFDMPEGESEIVGWFLEYSSMRFGVFALSEFIAMVGVGALGSVLFLGGWHIPFVSGDSIPLLALQVGAMLGKTLFLVYVQMLIRWTLPRFRYDQLMRLGWQYLLPLSLANILITGIVLMLVK
jgi:NADH-quinone oxidoreductase subunit H